jgi:molecular chaperone DnaK (HSP70)
VRVINEPTAAALAYESGHQGSSKILIYDLGGGTFDVSIVNLENGVVEVLAAAGDNHLGGDDFDQKILNWLIEHIEGELGLTVGDNRVLRARLLRAAEQAKIYLSDHPFAKIEEDHIGRKGDQDVHLSVELPRHEFEEMIEEDLLRTMDAVTRALSDASMLPSAIDKILLSGGSTRIPRVVQLLREKLGKEPHGEIDPDLCVALGAAMQAGMEMGVDVKSILVDILPPILSGPVPLAS